MPTIGTKTLPKKFTDRFRVRSMKVGEQAVVHIVNGPAKRVCHTWPTFYENQVTKMLEPTWKTVYVNPDETNDIEKLANTHVLLMKAAAEQIGQDPKTIRRSMLSKSDRFDYAVIAKDRVGTPVLCEIMEANWQTHSGIDAIKRALHPTKPGMLHYGLPFMFDIVIEKVMDEKTRREAYKVNPLDCKTEGAIDVAFLDDKKQPYPNMEQFFSEAELQLISEAKWELEDLDKACSPQEVRMRLTEFPLDLGRTQKNNPSHYFFFNNKKELDAIINYVRANEFPFTLPTAQDLRGLSEESHRVALPAGTAVEEALPETEEVQEAQPAVEAPVAPAAPTAPPKKVAEAVPPVRQEAPTRPAAFLPAHPVAPVVNSAPATRPVAPATGSPFQKTKKW